MQENCIDYYEEGITSGEKGCCLLCEDAEPGCICYDCKCKKCYWYEYFSYSNEGECELATMYKLDNEEGNRYSNKKVRNAIKCDSKAVFGQIENSKLLWIPLSVISNEGYIKNWFVKKHT